MSRRPTLPLVPLLAALVLPIGLRAAETPYVVPIAPGVTSTTVLSVGDAVGVKPDGVTPYRFCGIPDGLGAFDNGDGTFTLLMNHELTGDKGVIRAHGAKGAFVSKWTITKTTLAVSAISDLIQTVKLFDPGTGTWATAATPYAFTRFCSADLPAPTAYFNAASGKGSTAHIFMNGEEVSPEGTPPTGRFGLNFAHVVDGPEAGISYEIPRLGKYAPENTLACPLAQDKTVVMGNSDNSAAGGFVYLYVGTKTTVGTEIDKAGLTNGTLFGVRANGQADETRAAAVGAAKGTPAPFTLVALGDVSAKTGEQLFADSTLAGATRFLRPEDGAWDPSHPDTYYFVTTDDMNSAKNGGLTVTGKAGRTRLWQLHFTDIANPENGGTITNLIDGTEDPGPQMMDNITVDHSGRIVICEDTGNNDHLGKVWLYDIATGSMTVVASHDPARFGEIDTTSGTPIARPASGISAAGIPFTRDEETSGVLDVSEILGAGKFLIDVQAHVSGATVPSSAAELVEGGQLLALTIPASTATPVATGPDTAYLVPTASGVATSAILTVGQSVNLKPGSTAPYRFCGIPDGLGAFDNLDGTFTLLMNHEINSGSLGIVRAHGSNGAFVSRWTISKSTLAVTRIVDQIHTVMRFDPATSTYAPGPYQFQRFCSADLPAPTAYFNPFTGKGTSERIFMNGEEISPEGAPPTGRFGSNFAHIATGAANGTSFELPRLGKYAPENTLANPFPQDKTVVMGNSDNSAAGGFVYLYVGTKTTTGTDIDKAGLTNGTLFGVRANGKADETRADAVGAAKNVAVPFTLVALGDVSAKTGEQLFADSTSAGATRFLRPEDGAWDPSFPSDYYFVTTDDMNSAKNGGLTVAGKTGRTRLWKLHFTDIANPESGGTITNLISGAEDPGPQMMDNMTIDKVGRIIIDEDPGNQDHLGKMWSYDIHTGALTRIASHDPARFGDISTAGGTPVAVPAAGIAANGLPFSKDEESSGVLDVSDILGANRFLVDVQAHLASGTVLTNDQKELAEGGQLLAMTVALPNTPPVAQADTLTAVKDGKLVVAASALSANDTDADGDPVLVTAVSAASSQGGTVALVDGRVIYTPHAGFIGTDTFTYTLRDGARVSKPIPIDAPLASVPVTGGAVPVLHAGYGSAVAQAPGVANEYFLLTDRGPNIDGPTSGPLTGGKIFPVPAFHPEIARVRMNADGTVTRLATITLK
ncbi:MAG: DUF839 domain-containing protein, partial [Planctomycetes bacterium]|nr:DUF839 domain-containing protein [Planctomycetota bacterium]